MTGELVTELIRRWSQVAMIEFAVKDVPPLNPVPWESYNVVIACTFPADRCRGLHDRITAYRLSITLRRAPEEAAVMTHRILIERISHILALPLSKTGDAMR